MPSTPSSHKPRKKRRADISSNSSNGTVAIDVQSKQEKPAFPLVAFFWPARTATSQWVILSCIFMVVGLFRWCTAIWPYSGYRKPPMHGDFEAQRHWLEITVGLPMTHWYFHDLQWWGLDYPPLTAYHSWILGKVGSLINPDWFALYLSRALDDADLKVFMRATVMVSEYLVYVPAVVICGRHMARLHNINPWELSIALTAILMQPATMLIDHGHFQYNTVMLGFVLASMSNMLAGRPLWSCVCFVAALGFKQMALFYAPAVAAYLAGSCLFPRIRLFRLICIAATTLASFALLYLPLLLGTLYDNRRNVPLPTDIQLPPLLSALPFDLAESAWYYPYVLQLAQSIHRIFPFSRGLFEDKVANIWCAIHSSGVHKLHNYSSSLLSRAALGLTLLSILPPCTIIFFKPKKVLTPLALAVTAWGFFLCSYQVHEKNVLLPLLPMTMLLASEGGMKPSTRAWVGYANILACWTLFPLLVRDGLRIPYFVLSLVFAYLLGLPPVSFELYTASATPDGAGLHWFAKILHLGTYLACIAWHVVEAFFLPPTNKPDLFVVANVCVGAAGFGVCYLWCLWRLLSESGILQDLGLVKKEKLDDDRKRQ
ncbi:ALG6, ALG8 glycosyltransferase family-domain-containing protein [Neohortaea acidophila]|uniref:Alpha-1,3-glucosyltransferase n=1 Tax=Neohortaea acidophila TaxID=245834 RepID=A0A6A6PML3_9PEZI|nr:ALG6, ALG8 glycosyltransferase family-domain-containing protein [Neohortaea acidophila]KAF2480497.1 ALG6, ALG8 glycosyltransferase family-domain-containing protein [Neohortaea acidophila]